MPPKSLRRKAKPKEKARARGKVRHPDVISRPRTIACFRRRHNEDDAHPELSISEAGYQEDKDNDAEIEEEEEYIQTNLYLILRLPPPLIPKVTALISPNPLPLPPPPPLHPSASTFIDETSPFLIPTSFNPSSNSLDRTAIFPPGVPMSASEILAFYPQHLTWPDVSQRLDRNGWTGEDVRGVGSVFRDGVVDVLRGWEVGITEKGKKGVKDMTTSAWVHPSGTAKSVPSLEQLVTGVNSLPTGIGRRHLTSVLEWYLSVRHTFTPPLDLNVLHTCPLIQALRLPLRRYGPQNVDAAILSSYKQGGRDAISSLVPPFSSPTSIPLPLSSFSSSSSNTGDTKRERSKITLNLPRQTVKVEVLLRVGSVLLMPYFGVGGLVCRALEWGVGRAEGRRRGRLERAGKGRENSGGGEGSKADDEVARGGDMNAEGVPRGYVGSGKRARDEDDEGQEERERRVKGAPRGGTIG